jgi:hypothetical protein
MLPVACKEALTLTSALFYKEIDGQGGDSRQDDQDDDHAPTHNVQGEDTDRRLPLEGDADDPIEARKFAMP